MADRVALLPRTAHPTPPARAKARLDWIDHARGFYILWMLLGDYVPETASDSSTVLRFLLVHAGNPAAWADVDPMTGYDTVMLGFLFIIGMLMRYAFDSRRRRFGWRRAVWHVVAR